MPNNYSYRLRLFNDYNDHEVVTFSFAPGQSGNANPNSLVVNNGKCEQMEVTEADRTIELHVKLQNASIGSGYSSKVLPRNGSGCTPINQENCELNTTKLKAKTWSSIITHTCKSAKIIYYDSVEPGNDIYTDGKTIFIEPPKAQTPVTATDKQS